MSVTCTHCGTDGKKWQFYKGEYCNKVCYNREEGKNILQFLKYNHTYCASCGSKLKDIQKPRASDPEFIIGFQYNTENATKGEKTRFLHSNNADWETKTIDATGTICNICGATDHTDTFLRRYNFKLFLKNIVYFVISETDKDLNYTDFFETIKDGFSVEYSLGKSIE